MKAISRTIAWIAILGLLGTTAHAAETLTRPMAMGGAFRGHGAGNGSLYANPATMALINAYSVELSYLGLAEEHDRITLSVADSKTSRVAAGVAYSYVPIADQDDDHETRMSLAMAPMPGVLSMGVMGRYAWLGEQDTSGLSLDAGVAVSIARLVGLGVVVHNLMPNEDVGQHRHYGAGVAFTGPVTAAFDLLYDPDADEGDGFSYHSGLELLVAQVYPVRAGYEAHPDSGAHYLCLGVGALSERAGLQLSLRQRLDDTDDTSFGVSLNLYL